MSSEPLVSPCAELFFCFLFLQPVRFQAVGHGRSYVRQLLLAAVKVCKCLEFALGTCIYVHSTCYTYAGPLASPAGVVHGDSIAVLTLVSVLMMSAPRAMQNAETTAEEARRCDGR